MILVHCLEDASSPIQWWQTWASLPLGLDVTYLPKLQVYIFNIWCVLFHTFCSVFMYHCDTAHPHTLDSCLTLSHHSLVQPPPPPLLCLQKGVPSSHLLSTWRFTAHTALPFHTHFFTHTCHLLTPPGTTSSLPTTLYHLACLSLPLQLQPVHMAHAFTMHYYPNAPASPPCDLLPTSLPHISGPLHHTFFGRDRHCPGPHYATTGQH